MTATSTFTRWTLVLLAASVPRVAAAQPGVAASARPAAVPVQVSLDVETSWNQDEGHRLFSDEQASGAIGLSLQRDAFVAGGAALALGLGWLQERSQQGTEPGRELEARLRTNTVYADAVLRFPLGAHVAPYVRIAAGAAHGRAQLSFYPGGSGGDEGGLGANAGEISDNDWSPTASAGAGLRLHTAPRRLKALPEGAPAVAASLRLEGGYSHGSPFRFAARPTVVDPGKEDDIAVVGVPLGEIERSRPYLRIAVAVHF